MFIRKSKFFFFYNSKIAFIKTCESKLDSQKQTNQILFYVVNGNDRPHSLKRLKQQTFFSTFTWGICLDFQQHFRKAHTFWFPMCCQPAIRVFIIEKNFPSCRFIFFFYRNCPPKTRHWKECQNTAIIWWKALIFHYSVFCLNKVRSGVKKLKQTFSSSVVRDIIST